MYEQLTITNISMGENAITKHNTSMRPCFLFHTFGVKKLIEIDKIPLHKNGLQLWNQKQGPKTEWHLIQSKQDLSWALHFSQRTMALKAWLFAKQCFSTGQRLYKIPCQQRAVAKRQWTSSAKQRLWEMGGSEAYYKPDSLTKFIA